MGKIRTAIIGLGFGAEFIPVFKAHPDSDCVALCRRNADEVNRVADLFGVEKRYTDFEQVLDDPDIDAVHINTPLDDHGPMSAAALKAGKHVACTCPVAMTVEGCDEIAELEKKTGKVYMMMETTCFTREYLYVKSMYDRGEMGSIQFMRAAHQQNMSLPGWPDYWYGLPPMYYATHVISPLSDLIGKRVTSVRCYGSGQISKEYAAKYNSPFAVQTAQLTFEGTDVVAEVTRSLFDTIRQYRESFDIYGTKLSFEWEQLAGENPVIFSGFEDAKRIEIPDAISTLPKELVPFTLKQSKAADEGHVTQVQGSGHGGSYPHMVHEFVSAIKENRKPRTCAQTSANWCKAGILAHLSSMRGGERFEL